MESSAINTLQQGTYGASGEVLDWSYYDSMPLLSTVTSTRLFTVQLGQAGKTLANTNLTSSGQIPQGQRFTIRAIKVMYKTAAVKATAVVQAYYDFLANTSLQFIIPNKGPMGQWNLLELMGVASAFALTPTAAGDNIPLISPRFHGISPLNTPLTLAALTPFYVEITQHTAGAATLDGDRLIVSLMGTLVRGV